MQMTGQNPHLDICRAAQRHTEITDFDAVLRVQKQVHRFQVAVQYLFAVNICTCKQESER
jgi:hypothetical protein